MLHLFSLIIVMCIGTESSLLKINIYEEKPEPFADILHTSVQASRELKRSSRKKFSDSSLMQSEQAKRERERLRLSFPALNSTTSDWQI